MEIIRSFDKLKEYTNVYDGFARVHDCDIPDYYKSVFPTHCLCGGEMIMTEPGHTQLQCCNPACWVKMGHRLAYFISKLGYKGFGTSSALTLIQNTKSKFELPTFLYAFLLPEADIMSALSEYYANMFLDIRDDLKVRPIKFSDAVSAMGIPGMGSRSNFFDVVKSPVLLLQYLLKNRSDELCDACGINAPMTRFQLREFKLDIITLMIDVVPNITNTPAGEVYVAITGRVTVDGQVYTRPEFIALCESIKGPKGEVLYTIVETKAAAKLQYVVADEPSTSSKYRLGQELGILVTADEFYKQLKENSTAAGTSTTESNDSSDAEDDEDSIEESMEGDIPDSFEMKAEESNSVNN